MRWLVVGVGCVTALGLRAGLDLLSRLLGWASAAPTPYVEDFLALVLAGFVAGHLAGRWRLLHGALSASLYILVLATVVAAREAALSRQLGLSALPPLDFGPLFLSDVAALIGGTLGAWLSGLGQPRPADDMPASRG